MSVRGWWWLAVVWLGLGARAESPRIRILTTIPPIYSWVANIVGESATVENLLPADVGPHSYSFRPKDLKRIASADLLIANGLGLEDWLDKAIRGSRSDLRVLKIGDSIPGEWITGGPELRLEGAPKHDDHDHDHAHSEGGPNPHLWLDPRLAILAVGEITRVLAEIDPDRAPAYRTNASGYTSRLEALDLEVRTTLQSLQSRKLVTYHNAFPYFVRRYDLDLVGVLEEVPNVDPSPKYIASLLRVIREKEVRAIFTEPQFNPRLARRLAKDLGIGCVELDVMETGPLDPGFYEQGIRRNAGVLRATLGPR